MPRDAAGNYTLPAGNPVIAGTVITSTWANPTMSDIGNELTNSLSRNGQGGMLAPLFFFDGTKNDPAIAFTNEPTLGFYRPSGGVVGVSGGGKLTLSIDTGSGDITAPAGQMRAGAVAPVDDSDLTRKDYVDALFEQLINKPVGAVEFGYDPNGILNGTWTQLPEGAFIMNTLGGADPSGGSNDAEVIEHTHAIDHDHTAFNSGGESNTHTHNIDVYDDNSNDGPNPNGVSDPQVVATDTTKVNNTGHTHNIDVPAYAGASGSAGVNGAGKNRPLYVGVAIWQRTA